LTGALRASQMDAGARPPPSRSLPVRGSTTIDLSWTSPDFSSNVYDIRSQSAIHRTRPARPSPGSHLPVPSTRRGHTDAAPSPTVGKTRGELRTRRPLQLDPRRIEAKRVRRLSTAIAAGVKDWAHVFLCAALPKGHKSPWNRPTARWSLVPSVSTCAKVSEAEGLWSTAGSRPCSSPTKLCEPDQESSGAARLPDSAPRSSSVPATTRSHVRQGTPEVADRSRGGDPDGRPTINEGWERDWRGARATGPRDRAERSIARPGDRLAGSWANEGPVLTAWPNEEKRAGDDRRRLPA
jgi:hypothetical protein